MDLNSIVGAMTPEVYARLLAATETGKWPNGTPLTDEQKEHSLQAVMLYQAKVLNSDEHMTVNGDGEVVQKSRQEFKQELSSQQDIVRFKENDF